MSSTQGDCHTRYVVVPHTVCSGTTHQVSDVACRGAEGETRQLRHACIAPQVGTDSRQAPVGAAV